MVKGIAIMAVIAVFAANLPVGKPIGPAAVGATTVVRKPVDISRDDRLAVPCGVGTDIRSSELCAQWRAVDAASTANQIAIYASIFAFAAMIAALAAAWYSRRTLHADRAWITLDAAKDDTNPFATERIAYPVGLIWKNTGRSPAVDVVCTYSRKLAPIADATPVFGAEKLQVAEIFETVLAPGQSQNWPIIAFDEDEVRRMFARTHVGYLYCRVQYSDIFNRGEVRVSEISRKVGISSSGATFKTVPIGPQNNVV